MSGRIPSYESLLRKTVQLKRQYARLRRHECRTDPERPQYRVLAALLPMPLPRANLARKSGLCPAQTLACLRDLEKIGLAVQTTDGTWTHAVRTTFGRKAVEASRDARPGMPRVAIEALQWLDKPASATEIAATFGLAPELASQITSYLFEIGAVRGYGSRSKWKREDIWLAALTFDLLPKLKPEFTRDELRETTGLLPGPLAGLLKLSLRLRWLKVSPEGAFVRQSEISWSHLYPVRTPPTSGFGSGE